MQTSCVYRRNTFFGTYETTGRGPETIVSVDYRGVRQVARAERFPVPAVAETLLTWLVVREATEVRAGTMRGSQAGRSTFAGREGG